MSCSKWSFRRMKPPKEPRGRQEIKAELEELTSGIFIAKSNLDEAQEELDRAEAVLEELTERKQELLEELEPLLRPWERARHKAERKITAWVQVISG